MTQSTTRLLVFGRSPDYSERLFIPNVFSECLSSASAYALKAILFVPNCPEFQNSNFMVSQKKSHSLNMSSGQQIVLNGMGIFRKNG